MSQRQTSYIYIYIYRQTGHFSSKQKKINYILYQDHFTDIRNGDMDGTNNSSECINRSLKKFTSCGAKSLNTVFRSIYNFKVDQNKRMMCATRKKKRNGKTIEKFNRIKDILSDFDTLSPDEHISSLCTTLERLGSLQTEITMKKE